MSSSLSQRPGRPGSLGARGERRGEGAALPRRAQTRGRPSPAPPAPWDCPTHGCGRDSGNVQSRSDTGDRLQGWFGHRPSLPRHRSCSRPSHLAVSWLCCPVSPQPGDRHLPLHGFPGAAGVFPARCSGNAVIFPGLGRGAGGCGAAAAAAGLGDTGWLQRSPAGATGPLMPRGCPWPGWPRVAAAARGPAVLSAGNKGPFLPCEWAQCAQPPAAPRSPRPAGLGSAGPRGHGAIQGKGTESPRSRSPLCRESQSRGSPGDGR